MSWYIYIYIVPVNELFCHHNRNISVFVLISLCLLYTGMHWYVCIFGTIYSWLHLILRILCYFSPVSWLFYKHVVVTVVFELISLCLLYQCLQKYVWLLYIIYSLAGIQIGMLDVYIYWFIIPLFSSLFTCTFNSGLTPPYFNLPFSCRIHWNT